MGFLIALVAVGVGFYLGWRFRGWYVRRITALHESVTKG